MDDVIVLLCLEKSIADLADVKRVERRRREIEKKVFISFTKFGASSTCVDFFNNISSDTYQANHNKHRSKWQVESQIFLRWIKLLLLAAFHAPAHRYNANSG